MKYCDNLFSQKNLIIKSLKFKSNLHSRSHPMCLSFHAGHFRLSYKGYLFDFSSTHAISTPVISDFWSVFLSKPYFLKRYWYEKMCNYLTHLLIHMKKLSHTVPQTPTQKLKSGFSTSSSRGIASSLVLFEMIFEALQSELFRFKFHAPSLKILKITEFNLPISYESHNNIPF